MYVHSGPENLKKSRPKKGVKSNKSISRNLFFNILHENYVNFFGEIVFLVVLNFSQFKNYFLAIFEIAKNGIWSKKCHEIDMFDFTSFFFWPGFLKFSCLLCRHHEIENPPPHLETILPQ